MGNFIRGEKSVDEEYLSIILKRTNPSEQIELISDDDQRIPIHRVILTAASKYFAALLGPNFQEGNRKEIPLRGTNGETLRMIVNYCYTGRIKLTKENVRTFLTIASSVQLDLLEEKCRSFHAERLSVTTSVEALMIAEEFKYAELRKAALDFICEKFELVPSVEVQKLDHQSFHKILESDKITSSEEMIFDRLLKWSEREERKPYVPNLLKLIRLQHIKLEFLRDNVEAMYKKFDCTELMLAEYRRRASGSYFNSGFRRYSSLFCLFTKYKDDSGSDYSVIKFGGFKGESSNLEEIAELALGELKYFTPLVLNQNKIFALGGSLNGVHCNTVLSFDLNSRQKEILPKMNISRSNCTAILFGEYIYVFGGSNGSGYLSSCERFDTKSETWTEIKSMSEARCFASAVIMNGCIYIAGGLVGSSGATSTFESYDPTRNVWTVRAPMNIPRCSLTLIQSSGFIYAIGFLDTIEKYDPSKNEWTKISHSGGSWNITSGINVNGEIYVMKGNGELRQIKIDESDNFSFFPWVVETAYISEYPGNHFLTLN